MRYLLLLLMCSSGCLMSDNDHQVLDQDEEDIFLTIAHDWQTVELSSTVNEVPKNYRLQLHAVLNNQRELAQDEDGKFLPLMFAAVIFSYLQEKIATDQNTITVYTCVVKNVALGKRHKLVAKDCTAGAEKLQAARACVAEASKHFVVAEDSQPNFTCEPVATAP